MTYNELISGYAEPVDYELAKEHLSLNTDDELRTVTTYLRAARQEFEDRAGIALMTQTRRAIFKHWDSVLELPYPPLQGVSSITYVDTYALTQTLSPSQYHVDLHNRPGRIVMLENFTWPALHSRITPRISVTYTAGYTSASAIPADIITAILLRATDAYEQRANIITGTIVATRPAGFDSVVLRHWVGKLRYSSGGES